MIYSTVAWVLVVLSFFSFSLHGDVREAARYQRIQEERDVSRRLAEAGVRIATRAVDEDPTPAVDHATESWSNDPSRFRDLELSTGFVRVFYEVPVLAGRPLVRYGVCDEDGRLNVNWAARSELLRLPGVTEEIADGILDWRDADDETRRFGAEAYFYEQRGLQALPSNRSFESLEELRMVRGITDSAFQTFGRFITVYGDSVINVLTAPVEVLGALGMSKGVIDKVVGFRDGEANLEGLGSEPTGDTFVDLLDQDQDLTRAQETELRYYFHTGRLKFSSELYRIRAEGRADLPGEQPGDGPPMLIEAVYRAGKRTDDITRHGVFLYWREH